ncbi:hypothetical protein Ddye_032327 [Dipteronia dyeriana]|uniref:Uncharacterized protein n=1 Tax=Dipteronia dyeriana TaxID=168575 RepID=A0AAD9TK03_9ROSI|nr:hypothetical protein Ddye_032327 [Dipteronia dyeriana]
MERKARPVDLQEVSISGQARRYGVASSCCVLTDSRISRSETPPPSSTSSFNILHASSHAPSFLDPGIAGGSLLTGYMIPFLTQAFHTQDNQCRLVFFSFFPGWSAYSEFMGLCEKIQLENVYEDLYLVFMLVAMDFKYPCK